MTDYNRPVLDTSGNSSGVFCVKYADLKHCVCVAGCVWVVAWVRGCVVCVGGGLFGACVHAVFVMHVCV